MAGTVILNPIQLGSSTGAVVSVTETGSLSATSQVMDGLGNPIDSTETSTGKALNVHVYGASVLSINNLTASTPLSQTGGTGAVFSPVNISIANAKADNTTKGAATFKSADFEDDGAGKIAIDYVNGQKATNLQPGFLTAADWTTFNSKQGVITTGNLTSSTPLQVTGGTGAVIGSGANISVPSATTTSTGVVRLSNSYIGTSQTLATTEKALSDGLATKENTLTKGNLSATSPLSQSGGIGAVIGSGVSLSIADAKADSVTKGGAAFTAADFNDNGSGLISIDYTNGQKAGFSQPGFLTSSGWSTFNNKQDTLTIGNITGSTPISVSGGTGAIIGSGVSVSIPNAKADTSTKGASTFKAADFNDDGSGLISIDYINGQQASASQPGFLTSSGWITFNNKQDTLTNPVTGTGIAGQNAEWSGTSTIIGVAKNTAFNQNFETNTANILMDGVVSVGALSTIPRADHRHATDTSRQTADADLTAIAALTSTGIAVRTAADTWATRLLSVGSTKVSISNPAGIADNPSIDIVEANIIHQNISGHGTNDHTAIDSHISSTSNPHSVTKTQVGLGNVTNDRQVKATATTTIGNIPTWSTSTGDALNNGYGVDTVTLSNSSSKIPVSAVVKAYADSLVIAGGMVYKGVIDCSGNPNYTASSTGWVYVVSVAGKIGGASGATVEVGDMIICTVTNAGGTQAAVGAYFDIVQANLTGVVIGPSSATNNRVAAFDGATGKLIKDSGYLAQDASTTQKGFTQLSNLYNGTSQTLATTEKALSDGLATKEPTLTKGNLTANSPLSQSGGTGAVIGSGVSLSIGNASADGTTKGASTYIASDFNDNGSGLISLDYANGQKASGSQPGFLSSADWTTFNSKEPVLTKGNLTGTTPVSVTGGTGAVIGSGAAISVGNAAADGATKGIAAFTANDFDATTGVISIDYTNGQAASATTKGFLTAANWTTFNSKEPALTKGNLTGTSPITVTGGTGAVIGSGAAVSIGNASADGTTKGISTYAAGDFNDNGSGVISVDYTNGQKASGSQPGFLSSTDWTTFNSKEPALTKGNLTAGSTKITLGGTGTGALIGTGASVDVNEANLTLSNMIGPLSIAKGGSGQITANAALNAFLPSQTGNNGKVLGTNGSNTSWVANGGTVNKCRVTKTSAQNIPNNSLTKVQLNSVSFDTDTEWNAVNYRFVAKTAGYYSFSAKTGYASTTANGYSETYVYVNGVEYSACSFYKNSTNIDFVLYTTDVVYLDVDGYIELWAWQGTGGARALETGQASHQSSLAIFRIP